MSKILSIIGFIFGIIISLVLIFGLLFGLEWLGIEWQGYFGPKHADVERAIFRETQSFNRGAEIQLADYRLQYFKEDDPVTKQAIMSTVRSQFADVDPNNINNPDIRLFLNQAISGVESPKIDKYQK